MYNVWQLVDGIVQDALENVKEDEGSRDVNKKVIEHGMTNLFWF
jgi:hypothetical protein